ncbi:MAG: beta-lactamase family protein [Actinobacteria bacterium]|nr:MAG: beta-lactamase family protein [Actinomycetota bacterium]
MTMFTMPRAPASLTARASGASAIPPMPACCMGTEQPTRRVNAVSSMGPPATPSAHHLEPLRRLRAMALDKRAVDDLLTRVHREVDSGLLPSCQVALGYQGELAVFETYGDATPETRYVVFSCTKAIMAAAAWQLIGEGLLDPAVTVVEVIPEFMAESRPGGREAVTVESLMTHTAGFPHAPMGPPEWWTREGRLERFSQWRFNWDPGTRFEYHPTTAHWVLAEVLERVAGMDYRDLVRRRIALPLDLPRLRVGLPPGAEGAAEGATVAELVARGEPCSRDELMAAFGVPELPVTEVTEEALLRFNDPRYRELGVPGGGGIMTAADLALFYQALLHNPGGLWDPDVLADGTGRVRTTYPDPFLGMPALRTLGVVVAGDDGKSSFRGFGKTVSPRAFGHGGAGGQIGWADPATGLSLAYCTNGIDANQIRQPRRGVAISSLAGVCAPR